MSDTPEQVDEHARASAIRARGLDRLLAPPRRVTLPVRCHLLFGGFLNQFGWFFFGFGMIFFWVFVMNADLRLLGPSGGWATTQGVVTSIEKTGMSENKVQVQRINFKFKVGKNEYEGKSYSLGSSFSGGETTTIEYAANKPADSRIVGLRQRPFSGIVLFVIIFPLVGFCFFFFGYRRGKKAIELLTYGILGEGKLISKEPTNTSINNRTVMKLTFEFDAIDGQKHTVEARTHLPERLEDEATEFLFYRPESPDKAVMLDDVPTFRVDEAGNIQPESSRAALLSMIVPGLTIASHGTYVLTALL